MTDTKCSIYSSGNSGESKGRKPKQVDETQQSSGEEHDEPICEEVL